MPLFRPMIEFLASPYLQVTPLKLHAMRRLKATLDLNLVLLKLTGSGNRLLSGIASVRASMLQLQKTPECGATDHKIRQDIAPARKS